MFQVPPPLFSCSWSFATRKIYFLFSCSIWEIEPGRYASGQRDEPCWWWWWSSLCRCAFLFLILAASIHPRGVPPPVDWFHFFCQCVVSDVLADSLAAGKNESNNFCLFEMEAKRKVFWVERQRKWGHRRSGWRQAAAVVIFLRKKNGRGLRWYARLGV